MAEQTILTLPLEARAELAIQAAFKKLVTERLREGLPVYLWQGGQVVAVSPQELSSDFSQ
jgi:hypothetical protein